jgi:hypothetical protein
MTAHNNCSAGSANERTGHCPLCWTYSKSDDYCSSFEEAIASTAERPMGCPWFTSEDRANWRARHKSSDGEPSNGKQPLMASQPSPAATVETDTSEGCRCMFCGARTLTTCTPEKPAEGCLRSRLSADTVPARETVARILAHKMPSLRMANDTPGNYAHSIADEIVAALTNEPQALGTAAHWKERHDAVLQKHIECCGQVDAATRQALEGARQAIEYSIDMGCGDPAGVLLQTLNKLDTALAMTRPQLGPSASSPAGSAPAQRLPG